MGMSPQAFRHAVWDEYASGAYDEGCDDDGYRYVEMRMGLTQEFTPSGLPDDERSADEEQVDRVWYKAVRQILAPEDFTLVIGSPPPVYKRHKPIPQPGTFLYVRMRGTKMGCALSRRTAATTADAMRERFMGEKPGMAMLRRRAKKLIDDGRFDERMRRFTGME